MANIAQNQDIARRLREVAQLLEDQGANRFRVRAYRAAAETIERLTVPAAEIAQQQGTDGLQSLPGIGVSLARSIHTLVVTGRLPMLDRLRGRMDPVSLLTSIPGIGPALAHRLHDELHIETLEQLEMAAHDGRLADIEGIGPKKLQGIIDSLTARLGRVRKPPQAAGPAHNRVNLPSMNCWMWTGNIAKPPRRADCRESRRTASIQRKRPGCRSSTHNEAPAITPPCSRTAPWPINSRKRATGSSSTTMMTTANASAP